jgi:hypothetical protein
MPSLHICNTFFEQELEAAQMRPLKNWLCSNPQIEQLQSLPLLFAGPEDKVLVTHLPTDARHCHIDKPPNLPIVDWGASGAIAQYAKKHGLSYAHPNLDLVRQIQSKSFAFQCHPLPGAALLYTPQEVSTWMEKTPGPKVLKRVLGFAGRGHFFSGNLDSFLAREFSQNRPVLGEPWLSRTLDFSSQWEVGETVQLIGVTQFEASQRGTYLATLPVEERYRHFIDRHLEVAWPIVQKIQKMGFFGSLGIDAFVYGNGQVHPIVEVNARKTMGRVALEIQKYRGPVRMSFTRGKLDFTNII